MVGNILWGQRASMQDFTAARQIVVVIPVVISQPRQTVICMDAQRGLGLRDSAIKMVFDPSFSLPSGFSLAYSAGPILLLQQTRRLVNFLIV